MINPDFETIKKLANSYPNKVVSNFIYREVPRQEVKSTAVFGLPNTAVENLSQVIKRQLFLFNNHNDVGSLDNFLDYLTTIYSIAILGYIATSRIRGNKDLFALYHKSITEAFLNHGNFSTNLPQQYIGHIARNIAQMINIALVAFNLIDYPNYFTLFKQSIKKLENSLEIFDAEDAAIKEAKRLLHLMVY
jgi:hypothetical protein